MYPDPITPRAFPEILSRLDYDPFMVMPGDLPPAPRVFTTAGHLERARERIRNGVAADVRGLKDLVASCRLDEPLPSYEDKGGPAGWGGPLMPWLNLAFRNALAAHLTTDARHRQRALEAMRLAAAAAARISKWNGFEHNEAIAAARAYDLLASAPLAAEDDNAMRHMLWLFHHGAGYLEVSACNNHNVMNITGRLAVALALGQRQWIHDVFYGYQSPKRWRYGLIHALRHDFLGDGAQWEGSLSYHGLVLGLICECFEMLECSGVDLWRRKFRQIMKDEGFDEFRGYGPKGEKSLQSAFDVLLYQCFTNGDVSSLHDSLYMDIRSSNAWYPIFNTAWRVYGEDRYAWALRMINGGKAATAAAEAPPWLGGGHSGLEFVRIEARDFPPGGSPFVEDRQFAPAGRHVAGCTLFAVQGTAVLRADSRDPLAPCAHLYWGPHWSGHRSPAALHLDINAFGRKLTSVPFVSIGYSDDRHLTWNRTTIAHNTVTIDETPMFPYDAGGDSIWEYDLWRDLVSDGRLESFQANGDFSAVRIANDNVYDGVLLRRTVLLTRDYLLDIYHVAADSERQIDWALHGSNELHFELPESTAVDLGARRGYQHLTQARKLHAESEWCALPFTLDGNGGTVTLWRGGAPDVDVVLATDPVPRGAELPAHQSTLLLRTKAACANFVALWSFTDRQPPTLGVTMNGQQPEAVTIATASWRHQWRLEANGAVTAQC